MPRSDEFGAADMTPLAWATNEQIFEELRRRSSGMCVLIVGLRATRCDMGATDDWNVITRMCGPADNIAACSRQILESLGGGA